MLKFLVLSLVVLIAVESPRADAGSPAVKLEVKNARIFTMALGQRDPFLGYLLVGEDGTLLDVQRGDPPSGLSADQVVDAHQAWVIPGFISAHSHLWQAAYRGLAADKTLISWIDDLYFKRAARATPEDLYWFCLLGALDHLQSGITAVYDFDYARIYWKGDDNDFDMAQFRAQEESGIRYIHGYEPGMMGPGASISQAKSRMKDFLDWTSMQKPSPRFLGVMLNGGTAFNNTFQQSTMEKELMDTFSVSNQSHYLEPPEPATQEEERQKFRWFADSGLLSDRLIFGHFIHTNDFILEQAVKYHVGMTWNPLSNGRMASGVPDIPKYLHLGIRVGMGIDGEASGDLADPFENMRAGLYAIREKYEDATVISPYQMVWLHTMGSADVLGVQKKVGSLEKGKYADFLVIDPSSLGAVLEDPYANLVLVATPRDIERIYVGGTLEVEQGKIVRHSLQKVQSEVDDRVLSAGK